MKRTAFALTMCLVSSCAAIKTSIPQTITDTSLVIISSITAMSAAFTVQRGGVAPRWNWLFDCPTPASTTDQINQQINHAVNQPTRASIFLNQTQLDAYLRFREQNGELMNFTYVLVSDKSQPKAESVAGQIAAAVLGSLAGLGSVILGIVGVMKYRSRTPIGPLPSITTLNPLQSVQTRPGGPSPSGSNFHGAGTMSQTTVVGDDAESATIFVPPAGFEG